MFEPSKRPGLQQDEVQRIPSARPHDRHVLDDLFREDIAVIAGRAGLDCFSGSNHFNCFRDLADVDRSVYRGGLSDANFITFQNRFLEALRFHFDRVHARRDRIKGIGSAFCGDSGSGSPRFLAAECDGCVRDNSARGIRNGAGNTRGANLSHQCGASEAKRNKYGYEYPEMHNVNRLALFKEP